MGERDSVSVNPRNSRRLSGTRGCAEEDTDGSPGRGHPLQEQGWVGPQIVVFLCIFCLCPASPALDKTLRELWRDREPSPELRQQSVLSVCPSCLCPGPVPHQLSNQGGTKAGDQGGPGPLLQLLSVTPAPWSEFVTVVVGRVGS